MLVDLCLRYSFFTKLHISMKKIIVSFDSKFPDHPTNEWNTEELGETILNVVSRIKPHSVSI